jgi:hypothetical protein
VSVVVTLTGAADAGLPGGAGGNGDSVSFSMPRPGAQQFSVDVGCLNCYNGGAGVLGPGDATADVTPPL